MNGHSTGNDAHRSQHSAANGHVTKEQTVQLLPKAAQGEQGPAGLVQLVICIAGIYASL